MLKTFVEACLVLEEGVATHRDIDLGMMAGAGLDPRRGLLPPFMKADIEGLDTILERAGERRRRSTASASRRRRSCGAWSPRAASGRRAARASTPTRSPTTSSPARSSSSRPAATSRSRGWPTADELGGARGDQDLGEVWDARRRTRAPARWSSPPRTRCCSAPAPTSRRSRRWTRPAGAQLLDTGPRAAARAGARGVADDRRGQRPGVRRRLRAGDGLRRADRRALGDRSASPRSSSASSRASAAPSGCRASWARTRRWR